MPFYTVINEATLFVPLALLLFYGCFCYLSPSRSKGRQLPPGPKGTPFIGNVSQLPRENLHLTFTSWAKIYGPIVRFHVFGSNTIVLNTGKVASDLLESRSAIYSDRPKMWMLGELAGRESSIFLTSDSNPRFKVLRRLLQTGLNPKAAKGYRDLQMEETLLLLKGLLETPNDFVRHIRRSTVATILKVAYGYQVEGVDDPIVHKLQRGFELSHSLAVPGKYLVEVMPFLRFLPDWFPGAGFKREAKKIGAEVYTIEQGPFNWAEQKIRSGDYVDSFTSNHLCLESGEKVDEKTHENVKWASAALYFGGGDTTVSALLSFILLMVLHPDVQRKAQADIDCISQNQLPTLDDYDSLPYVRAIIKEVLRWAPVAPFGLFHRVTEDDVYDDYFIPKGSAVLANIWGITRDEEIYPDTETFDPSRHLGPKPQVDPFKYVFGFGRRVCPGAHLAEMSLFLNIVNILAVFTISKATDENGLEIEYLQEWSSGVTRHLKPFKCNIKPRSEEHVLSFDRHD